MQGTSDAGARRCKLFNGKALCAAGWQAAGGIAAGQPNKQDVLTGSRADGAGGLQPAPWHFLYFFPLPHGHGSLRPGSGFLRIGSARGPTLRHIWRNA